MMWMFRSADGCRNMLLVQEPNYLIEPHKKPLRLSACGWTLAEAGLISGTVRLFTYICNINPQHFSVPRNSHAMGTSLLSGTSWCPVFNMPSTLYS